MTLHRMSEQNILQLGLSWHIHSANISKEQQEIFITFLFNKTVLLSELLTGASEAPQQYPQKSISSCSHIAKLDLTEESATSSNSCFLEHRKFLKLPIEILRWDRQGRKMNVPEQPRNSSIFDTGLCLAHFSCSQEASLHSELKMTQKIVFMSGQIFFAYN